MNRHIKRENGLPKKALGDLLECNLAAKALSEIVTTSRPQRAS